MARNVFSPLRRGLAPTILKPRARAQGTVYGWHLDLEVEAKLGSGETRRAGYRCLFVMENRETPMFLAVVER